MKKILQTLASPFSLLLLLCGAAMAAPEIQIIRHQNCNLFGVSEPVQLQASLKGFGEGRVRLEAEVRNYFGESKKFTFRAEVAAGQPATVPLDFGVLDPGYYELRVHTDAGSSKVQSKMMSFGVVRFVSRTAGEALKQHSRFGLKIFQLGEPGVWWRKGEVWNLAEVVDACAKLGLQWTRHQFNQGPSPEPGVISTDDLIRKYPMNVVMKVEGFPENCYDVGRYGSLEEWKAKKKGKSWNRCTVPLKEPYQQWLKEQIAKIPSGQSIFEIGNEVWNYMEANEFAEWSRMSVEAIKQARPGAKVGADPGGGEYGRKFMAAGGMDNMDIWFNHPYSFTPLPEHRIRGYLRNAREIIRRRTGKEFELYITEYGWPIAPNDSRKHSVSEKVQAQRTTRQSLMLYAEDAKTLIPHWMGDREQDPTEREHWFGFFRLSQQPLPVVIAHANCARMIDGGRFVGDLWYGPGIGAMLFEKDGELILALWTMEEDKEARIRIGVNEVVKVDLMGGEKKIPAAGGEVSLKLNGDVVYLKGVSAELVKAVVPPGGNLNPDLWSNREESFEIARAAAGPQADGDIADWAGASFIDLKEAKPGTPSGSGTWMLRWDKEHVYAAFAITGYKDGSKEELEFGLGVRPDRQVDMGSTTLFDFVFRLKQLGEGKASLVVENADFDKALEVAVANDPSGIRWALKPVKGGWVAELAVPVQLLRGMPVPEDGLKLSGAVTVKDAENKKVLLARGNEKARLWPYLILKDVK